MNPNEKNHVRIKAFRAIDFPEDCDRFIEGHGRVLSSVGVDQVTSSTHEWKHNPASFVIICESSDGSKVYGGCRVHALGGSQDLPIEEATVEMDASVPEHIRRYSTEGTGELCGLWNSIEVAGLGIGAVYLIRCALAICPHLGIGTLWALCSPFTTRIAKNYGFSKYTKVGDEGKFYYPKLDLIATACFVKDTELLEGGDPRETDVIFSLKENLNTVRDEENRGRKLLVDYQLEIDNIDPLVFEWNQIN